MQEQRFLDGLNLRMAVAGEFETNDGPDPSSIAKVSPNDGTRAADNEDRTRWELNCECIARMLAEIGPP